jgi:hypothetical protein
MATDGKHSRRRRLRPFQIMLSAALVFALASPVDALQATNQAATNDGTVTMKVFLNYTTGHCSDGQQWNDVSSVSTKFTRTQSNRKVSISHLLLDGAGNTCSNVYGLRRRQGSWNPVFGCGGRCGANTTEALGISANWPGIRSQPGCDICQVGGAGDGHVKNLAGTAIAPNPICAVIIRSGGAVPCPDQA